MNNKISNPLLKQLISEIAGKTREGRIDIGWNSLAEINKKSEIKEAKTDDPLADLNTGEKEADPASSKLDAKVPAAPLPSEPDPATTGAEDSESPEDAQADAAKKSAEVEKAKAELKKAEDELEQNAYVKLNSKGGVRYLLGKLLSIASKKSTNAVDALAIDMAEKLNIKTKKDAEVFENDMRPYSNILGMNQLVEKIKSIATEESPE